MDRDTARSNSETNFLSNCNNEYLWRKAKCHEDESLASTITKSVMILAVTMTHIALEQELEPCIVAW